MKGRRAGWVARVWVAACVAAVLTACGGEQEQGNAGASGASMMPQAEYSGETAPARRTEVAPNIARVRFSPPYPKTGDTVRAIVALEGSDQGADPATDVVIEHVWTVGGVLQAARGAEITLSRGRKGDLIEVRVSTRSGAALGETVVASTSIGNSAPVVQSLQMDPASGLVANREVTALPSATDRDGDALSFNYSWRVNGMSVSADGPTLSTVDLRRGDRVAVSVFASDGEDDSDSMDGPEITLENAFPVIVSNPRPAGSDGVFRYRPRAEDPDGDRSLRFRLASAPRGMTIRSVDGKIEWRPNVDDAGTHLIEIVVEDPEGGRSSQRFEIVIEPPGQTASPASR